MRIAGLTLALSLLAVTTAAPLHAAPPEEQVDGDGGVSDFYRWSGAIGSPGKLLRQEPLPAALALPAAGRSSRILYSGTSGVGQAKPIIVSGTLYLPKGRAPKGGWPIVAWAHGTTGVADVCAPSWQGWSPRDTAYLGAWLKQGFAVVATDYEGLGTPGMHPYLLWRSEGQSVLDSVRAALAAEPSRLSNRVLVVGQSQGSGAALGATTLAPSYAPDIHLLGTVATGLVVTIDGDGPEKPSEYTDPTKMDGAFAMLRVGGIDRALHPELDAADFVTPKGRKMLTAARTSCLHDMFKLEAAENITGSASFSRDITPIDSDMDRNFRLPADKLTVPVFAGTGLADGMAGTEGQYNAVKAMCKAGTSVQWHVYPGLSHGGTVNGSLVDSIPFAQALLAGKPVADNCASIQPPGPVQQAKAGIPFQ
jgi:hypothetical protein